MFGFGIFDKYELEEFEPSWSTQLDYVGSQPHARESLERKANNMRSERKFTCLDGQTIDHPSGIQFSGEP